MGAVAVGTYSSIVVVGIPSTIVVNIAIVVVVDAIIGNFMDVSPTIEVFVGPIRATVDDGHNDGVARRRDTASGEFFPGLRKVHDGWCPLHVIIRVVRNRFAQFDVGVVVLYDPNIGVFRQAEHFFFSWLFIVDDFEKPDIQSFG